MKIKPFYAALLCCIFFSCRKDADVIPVNTDKSHYSITKNGLRFNSVNDYVLVTTSRPERVALTNFINEHSTFRNLAKVNSTDKGISQQTEASSKMTPSYSDSTDEDPDDLYPEYLQEILNDDSIVQFGKFYLKVDLVNDKGLAIDSTITDAYNKLKNSYPGSLDPAIMLFGQDEEVIAVLNWIENDGGTYEEYLLQKGGIHAPIFCFDTGAKQAKDIRVDYYDPNQSKVRFKTELSYQKAIIYFRLHAEGKAQKKLLFLWVSDGNTVLSLKYYDRWVQRCKRIEQPGESNALSGVAGPKIKYVAYEDVKSLRQYEMECAFAIRRTSWDYFQWFSSTPNHYIKDGY